MAATRFALQITLGNEAMESPQDVAEVLTDRVAVGVDQSGMDFDGVEGPYPIRDRNGNTVGHWAIERVSS